VQIEDLSVTITATSNGTNQPVPTYQDDNGNDVYVVSASSANAPFINFSTAKGWPIGVAISVGTVSMPFNAVGPTTTVHLKPQSNWALSSSMGIVNASFIAYPYLYYSQNMYGTPLSVWKQIYPEAPLVLVTVIYQNVTLVGVPTLFSFAPTLQNNVDGRYVQPADRKACSLLNNPITDPTTCARYGCVFNGSQCYLKPGTVCIHRPPIADTIISLFYRHHHCIFDIFVNYVCNE
jgi:hypothetical protein